jgi:macrolide transport system ATP-binding/permease protein
MIELKGINKTYGKGDIAVPALRDVSLSISRGEFIAIMGPSGSGKSTLLHVLGFLDRPDSGSYKVFDADVSYLADDKLAYLRNTLAGFVFQQFHLLRRTTALENVELPLIYSGKTGGIEKAREELNRTGLGHREKHLPNELSGGEQQRVAIARSLVNDPTMILADEPTGNLDTKSEEEIMSILKGLNDRGKTVIMVTHEKEIASYAGRVIMMRDGKIVSDETTRKTRPAAEEKISLEAVLAEGQHGSMKVELTEHIRQSFRAISANKVRSFLSILGVLFGVGAVIAMLALGQGARSSMEERIRSLGSNLLMIRGGSARLRGVASATGSVTRFTPADVDAIKDLKTLVRRVTGYVGGSGQAVYGSGNWHTSIEGVGYDYGEMRATIPQLGRWFTPEELARRERVVIVGLTVADKLFGTSNPIGEEIRINRISFKVIGLAPEKGARGWRDQDDVVYVPLTTAMHRLLGKDYLDGIYVEVRDGTLIETARRRIEEIIIRRHRIHRNPEDFFHIRDMSEIQEMLTGTTRTMGILLGSVAAISLLVGGIGIMNIMLVSVTERTREIGLRKALGARPRDIMTQFLIESVIMTLTGGAIGVFFGIMIAVSMSFFAGWATRVEISNIVLAVTFSIAVGMFFGLWPARKASRLNPIEALRYE